MEKNKPISVQKMADSTARTGRVVLKNIKISCSIGGVFMICVGLFRALGLNESIGAIEAAVLVVAGITLSIFGFRKPSNIKS